MTQVQVVAAVLDHELAAALKEGVGGKLPGDLAVDADHLGFQPQAGHHPGCPDPVEDLSDPAGEPAARGTPRADGVPPPFADLRVPAGVDAEVLGAGRGGGVDQRQQALGGGIGHQRVHVVVEDDGQPPGVVVRAADRAADGGQHGHRPVEPVRADRDAGRHGGERVARAQRDLPVMLGVDRAEERQVSAADRARRGVPALRARGGARGAAARTRRPPSASRRCARSATPTRARSAGSRPRPRAGSGPMTRCRRSTR